MAIDKKIAPPFYSLNKCNPRLSGNIKFVCDDAEIYIESIDSNDELSRSLYKAYKVNKTNNLMANVKNFSDLFSIKDNLFECKGDITSPVSDYGVQHERLYNYGAYSDTSELIKKRFRFFAPIQLNEESKKPHAFVVYRIDRDAFNKGKQNYVKELLHVHDFRTSDMGKMLDRHIEYLKNYPHDMGIFSNFSENLSYTGTSLNTGLMQSLYEDNFDSLLANERTITEFNDYIVDGFRRNQLIDSRYLNLEFCFDMDLSNIDLNDKFVDVVGFYVTLEELSTLREYNTSEFHYKLLEDNKKLHKVDGELTSANLVDNYITVDTALGVQYTSDNHIGNFTPLVMIEPKFIPNQGDKIILSLNGTVEVTYTIQASDIISNDIMGTAKKISESFTEHTRLNVSNLFVDAFIHDNKYLVIRSLISDSQYESIKVDLLPMQYSIVNPLFSDTTYNNTFYTPSNNSVLTIAPIGMSLNGADRLRLGTNNRKIKFVGRWLSYYFYNLDGVLKTTDSDPQIFEVIKTEKSKMYQLKLSEHRAFDFDREISYHEDVFDFELVAYKAWLIAEIDKPTFKGKYEGVSPQPTTAVLEAYKLQLKEIVDRYFDGIDLQRKMLLKDHNTDTFEATSVGNEYDRLKENDNIDLLKSNTINQHINKFMYANGLDVYNRPYMLNLNMPFRYYNFAPSLDDTSRDLRHSTHSWLVIGEGLPPYYQMMTVDGDPVIKNVEIETEQPSNTIQRFFGDLGVATDMSNWVKTNANMVSGTNTETAVLSLTNSNNSIIRPLNILSQAVNDMMKFNYKFTIKNSANTNVNIRISLVKTSDTSVVYKYWDIVKNVIGGQDLEIDEIKEFQLSLDSSNVSLKISVSVGQTSTLVLKDFNFYKGTMTMLTVDDTIKYDCADVEGYVKYVSDMASGYTTIPINTSMIKSKTTDVFNYIKSHSLIRKEDGSGTCFFRGLKVVVDSKYDGWKFASVLLTKTAPIGEDRAIQLYENNTFKSLVLVVNMYIPEPVLTSIEQPNKYWLDRSLLYFSDGDYASQSSLASFGLEDFSVKIHDTTSPKTYLGNIVTSNWYFQTPTQNYVHVSKGILSRFNVDFTTFMDLGQDLEVFFANTNNAETVNYGMLITFKEIQEITDDYFWCKEIHVKIKETNGGTTTVIEYDMLATYLANNNAFIEQNRMDIVEAILLENAKYNRVLRNTSAIARFSLLSTASIFEWINSNNVRVNKDDGTHYYSNMTAYKPQVNVSVIKLKEENNNLVELPQKYTNTFVRQNGLYNPVTKRLRKSSGIFTIPYCDFGYANKATNHQLLPTIQSNSDRSIDAVWFYRNNNARTDLSKHFRYYVNRKTFIDVDWWANPMEYKHEVSRLLSSTSEMVLEHTYDGNDIDVYNLVKTYIKRLFDNSGYDSTLYDDNTKVNIIKLGNENIDLQTLPQYNVDEIISKRFYDSCFNNIYNVELVFNKTTSKKVDFYEVGDDIIRLNDDTTIGDNIHITIDRI